MEEFAYWITDELEKLLGESYWMKYMEKEKGNGKIYHGILIAKKEEDIGPLVYIDYYMEKYQEGSLTIPEIASAILEKIAQHPAPAVDMDKIQNHYEAIKDQIRTAVCNYMANEEDLLGMPHKKFLDLATFYYVPIHGVEGWNGALRIRNELLRRWKISSEELIIQAEKNTRRLEKYSIFPVNTFMENLLEKFLEEEAKTILESKSEILSIKGHIVTNMEHFWGAGILANNSMLKNLADRFQDDIVIFPVSIHELIVVKKADYAEMPLGPDEIEEINQDSVHEEERLSNNIYLYSRDRMELRIYREGGPL